MENLIFYLYIVSVLNIAVRILMSSYLWLAWQFLSKSLIGRRLEPGSGAELTRAQMTRHS